ncbi:MAG: metallophosphoesterase [Dehalococcoidales bacterium]
MIQVLKKFFPGIIAFIGSFLIIIFFIWAFSQHGTYGLYHVNGFFKIVFAVFGVIALILPILGLLYIWIKVRKNGGRLLRLSIPAVTLAIPAVILPILLFSTLSGVFSPRFVDTPPQLLLTGSNGEYNIPDMAIYFTTAKTTAEMSLTWGNDDNIITLTEDKRTNKHFFKLTDLKPGTDYFYRLNNNTPIYFSTPKPEQLHFAVASDAHYGASDARNDLTEAMLSAIANPNNNFDLFCYLGDLVEYGFVSSQWNQALHSFNSVTANIPTVYAAGNHDTLFAGFGNHFKYVAPSKIGADEKTSLWNRIDMGNIHLFVLDVEWSAESFSAKQAQWLEEELESISADDWTIILSHGFYYASGISYYGWEWFDNEETIDKITPIFNKYKVDLVCSGHAHKTEVLESNGVTYAVCGAFGGLSEPEPTYISPFSIWNSENKYAFIDITIENNECTLVFRDPDFRPLYELTIVNNR